LNAIININGLSKHYGKLRAVSQLSLEIEQGSIFGILGPNGSGKTTTLGMLLGVIRPSAGSFSWFQGEDLAQAKKKLGALLETPNFYPYMSGRKNLELVAKIKHLASPNIDEVLQLVNLSTRANDPFKNYSLGMKQRLAIASALLGNPQVLVLDEPTNGLDPTGIAEVRQLILTIASKGVSVIIASHILAEIEKICSHVAVLRNGKLLFHGHAAALSGAKSILELASADLEELKKALHKYPSIEKIEPHNEKLRVYASEEIKPEQLNRFLAEQGIYLNLLHTKRQSLEEGFLNLIAEK
jgi:ABC-2 type transport system ATP-binding protein